MQHVVFRFPSFFRPLPPANKQQGSNDKAVRLLKLPGATARAAAEENENAYLNGKTLGNGNGHAYNGVSTGDNGGGDIALRGHTGTVRDVCFPSLFPSVGTPAGDVGRLLSVGAGDFACRVWDVEGGVMSGGGGPDDGMEPVATFRGHTDTVFSCSMLPGGNVRTAAAWGGGDLLGQRAREGNMSYTRLIVVVVVFSVKQAFDFGRDVHVCSFVARPRDENAENARSFCSLIDSVPCGSSI